jgi:hypothetical protein
VELTTNTGNDSPLIDYVIPVNGLTNFNFYYTSDGTNFLPGGTYKVTYKSLSQSLGYDIVTYSPNAGHTNGVQVRPFNNPPATPRGINGVLTGYTKLGAVVPLSNITVIALPYFGGNSPRVLTNADGYFSVYYENDNPNQFLHVSAPFNYEYYRLIISGVMNGCAYTLTTDPPGFVWDVYTSDPSSPSYYVLGAGVPVSIDPLPCQ